MRYINNTLKLTENLTSENKEFIFGDTSFLKNYEGHIWGYF